jgi:hypothetical protein
MGEPTSLPVLQLAPPATDRGMTSDADLRHVFDALSDRLQATVAREVLQVRSEVAARIGDLQPPADESGSSAHHLLRGVRAIDAAPSLTGVLDALVEAIAADGIRVAVVLVRGAYLRPWRDQGFDALPRHVAMEDAGPIALAARSRSAVSGWTTPTAAVPAFAAADRVCVAVPIALAGESVAVLYADRRASDAALSGWRATVETLVRHAARTLESMAAFRAAQNFELRTQK